MTAYGLAIDPGWLGHDPSDALSRCCDEVIADDTLLLEAWAEWQEAHEPEFMAALREMDRGNASPMSICFELAIIAAARKRMELLAGEARKAA